MLDESVTLMSGDVYEYLANEYNLYVFRVESTKVKSRTEAWNLSQGPHKLTCQYGQLLNQMS